MNLTLILVIVMVIYMVYMNLTLGKKAKKSRQLSQSLANFYDKEQVFKDLEESIENEPDPLYVTKYRIIEAWAAAYYDNEEIFRDALAQVDVPRLMTDGRKMTIGENEDSFFYLYLAIPNRLYYTGRKDLMAELDAKLAEFSDELENKMFYVLSKEVRKYYNEEGDLGREWYEKVNEGDYEGVTYTKQLIGVYKNICSAMLAAIAKKTGDEKLYQDQVPYLEAFNATNLGSRWLNELNIVLEKKKEDEPDEFDEFDESDETGDPEPDGAADAGEAEEEIDAGEEEIK